MDTETTKTKTETALQTPPEVRRPLSQLTSTDRREVLAIARDRETPLSVRRALLEGYDIPEACFAPDPGLPAKAVAVLETTLFALIGTAAAAASVVVIVSAAKTLFGKGAKAEAEAAPTDAAK